jgi:hypothetical protein
MVSIISLPTQTRVVAAFVSPSRPRPQAAFPTSTLLTHRHHSTARCVPEPRRCSRHARHGGCDRGPRARARRRADRLLRSVAAADIAPRLCGTAGFEVQRRPAWSSVTARGQSLTRGSPRAASWGAM